MKLYHYAPKENSIMTDGLLSISKVDRNLRPYAHRAGTENKEEVVFSGGRKVTGWAQSEIAGVYKAPLSVDYIRNLYVNDTV